VKTRPLAEDGSGVAARRGGPGVVVCKPLRLSAPEGNYFVPLWRVAWDGYEEGGAPPGASGERALGLKVAEKTRAEESVEGVGIEARGCARYDLHDSRT